MEPQPAAASNRLTAQHSEDLLAEAFPPVLTGHRLLTAQAMTLLMRIDRDIQEARAQFNQDWFRRLMRFRAFALRRLRRRWNSIDPPPALPLGLALPKLLPKVDSQKNIKDQFQQRHNCFLIAQ
jgi:hypothetical protein